ncbi:PTS sugar transporter subunit IIA, partial [uncultured Selenomonas sp.]
MRITDLLKAESIELGASPADKEAAIDLLADLMEKGGNLADKAQYKKDVLAREAEGTTGLGDGLATPHAKSAGVAKAGLAAMTVPQGMDYQSLDGKPSRLFFMIAAPDGANDE